MNPQYDFDEDLISQRVPIIQIPNFQPLITSRRRLNQLNNETLKNIELYLQQSKNRELERLKQLKAKQQFIGQKVAKHQMKKQQKIKEIQAIQKQKVLKQCTFKPNINASKGQRRNLNQFLENQNDHLKKIEAKKRNLKMNLENEKEKQSYRPKINNNSKNSRRNQGPIYERLYALKDKQNIPQNIEELNIQNTFKPLISQKSKKMSRNAPIEDLLYGDALRRQQKSKDIVYTQNTQITKIQKHHVNLNNEKFAAQKFIRQYFSVLEDLGINLSLHYKIDYIMFNQILKSMGFIKEDEQSQDGISVNERKLVYESYSIIQKFGVNARNICVFLLALIGIYHINPINFEQGQQSIPEKQFNLDQVEGRKLQKSFDILFRNRLNCQKYKKPQNQEELCSFQPKINKKSQQLAQKYRNQMLDQANQLLENYPQIEYSIPEDGIISHTDLLVLHRLAKQIERKQIKQNNQSKDMEGCTFKPTTNYSSMQQTLKNSKMSNFDSKLGEKKSFQLYNYYKSLQNKKQSLRVSREVVDSQCTFAPNLKKQKVSATTPYAKQIDETLYRMHKGRQQKQQKQKLLTRGQTNLSMKGSRQVNNQSFRNTSRLMQRQRNLHHQNSIEEQIEGEVPTLILDVNLGDKTDRINLYKKDENKLEEVAHEFAMKHELDDESEQKLLQLLQIQLNNVLEKIQEDQESEDFDHQN